MSKFSRQQQIFGLMGWLLLSFAVAATGAIASVQAKQFYSQLVQPSWAPPAGAFGPVWTILYITIALSAWMVWRVGGFRHHRIALVLFLLQLGFNALWSWLFFAWHQGALAFANILVLWLLIVATLVSFWRLNRLAGVILIPYLLWVSFASVLNYSIWQLNPPLLG